MQILFQRMQTVFPKVFLRAAFVWHIVVISPNFGRKGWVQSPDPMSTFIGYLGLLPGEGFQSLACIVLYCYYIQQNGLFCAMHAQHGSARTWGCLK